ncbi:hypothetical protein MTP99_011563 [Tenebrio molitor]|nr:hypothetical protein MTP99_011563 [Tenebrio molitor]CAH1370054.1 unnamed protein product [Tenebrio molitor]
MTFLLRFVFCLHAIVSTMGKPVGTNQLVKFSPRLVGGASGCRPTHVMVNNECKEVVDSPPGRNIPSAD